MKKIFIITGEPSGDKLASKVIGNLMKVNPNIEYLSVGGENLKKLGIETIFDLKEITYLGFTRVFLNIFKINKIINETVNEIIKFNPDILLTVDSPDFTLRVSEKVKKKLKKIKTIHYVAPQVWVWRKGRVKKIKKFIDYMLLLFRFEKPYFEKEKINCEFVGHPLLEEQNLAKIDINQIISKNKALISIFAGSRTSEINMLMPILIDFIKLMNAKYNDFTYIFHSTNENFSLVKSHTSKSEIKNYEIISDEKIKSHILRKSIFAVSKSGTVSLEICNAKIPSIIIYKMNFINFLIIKMLVTTKFANIINIAAKKEIIPELIQDKCNPKNIYNTVNEFLNNPVKIKNQILEIDNILSSFKTEKPSTELASIFINKIIKQC
jgi:lipid-A-disaccharide synthase